MANSSTTETIKLRNKVYKVPIYAAISCVWIKLIYNVKSVDFQIYCKSDASNGFLEKNCFSIHETWIFFDIHWKKKKISKSCKYINLPLSWTIKLKLKF